MTKTIPVEDFLEVDRLMQAFSFRDLQVTVTVATWMGHNGIDFPHLIAYLKMVPSMRELFKLGYFLQHTTPDHAKELRAFERTLDKELRKELRKARLKQLESGPIKFRD